MDFWQWIKCLNSQQVNIPTDYKDTNGLVLFPWRNSQIPLADFKFFSFLLSAFRIKNDVVLKKKSRKKAKRVFSWEEVLFSYVLYLDKELQELWHVTVNHTFTSILPSNSITAYLFFVTSPSLYIWMGEFSS